jgi:hypothetical protein
MAEKTLETELTEALRERFRNRKIDDMQGHINGLQAAKAAFEQAYQFSPGDIVVWKKGLKNRVRPSYNEPAIVLEILDEPLKDEKTQDSGKPYFNEPLDLKLGLLDADGDFLIFYYDKKRFEHYQE